MEIVIIVYMHLIPSVKREMILMLSACVIYLSESYLSLHHQQFIYKYFQMIFFFFLTFLYVSITERHRFSLLVNTIQY